MEFKGFPLLKVSTHNHKCCIFRAPYFFFTQWYTRKCYTSLIPLAPACTEVLHIIDDTVLAPLDGQDKSEKKIEHNKKTHVYSIGVIQPFFVKDMIDNLWGYRS